MNTKRAKSLPERPHAFARWILLAAAAASLIAGCAGGPNSAGPSRASALAEAIEEAERFADTAEGTHYFQAFSAYEQVLKAAAFSCAPIRKHAKTASDFAFFISADGRIAKVLTMDPNASLCAMVALQNVRLPPPPKPGWIIHLSLTIGLS